MAWEPQKRKCVVCDEAFTANHHHAKICSEECREKRRRGYARGLPFSEPTVAQCPVCDKEFRVTKGKAENQCCSPECRKRFQADRSLGYTAARYRADPEFRDRALKRSRDKKNRKDVRKPVATGLSEFEARQLNRAAERAGLPLSALIRNALRDAGLIGTKDHGGASHPSRQPDRIQCLECKRWFRALPKHLRDAHGMSDEDYRLKYMLPVGLPLVCEEWSTNQRRYNREHDTEQTLTAKGPKPGFRQRESVRRRRQGDYARLAEAGTKAAAQIDRTAKRRDKLRPFPVTPAQAVERLNCTPQAAYTFLTYCVNKGWLRRVRRGLYDEVK